MNKIKKFMIIIILLIFVIFIFLALFMIPKINKLNDFVDNVSINDISLSRVDDGIYFGQIDAGMIYVDVKVSIENHIINDIELIKHDNGKGDDANEIINLVIEKQSLDVDVISGATYSSKVILKAIENAINQVE